MLEVAFRELREAAETLRDKQAVRYTYFFSASIPVPNGKKAKAILVADQDADLEIFGLNGCVIAPANSEGKRVTGNTLFPFATTNPTAYAERGLKLNLYSGTDKNLQLTNPEILVEVKNVLQGGYMPGGFKKPSKFKYYLRRSEKLVFEFLNEDTLKDFEGGQLYHYVTLVLSARKYDMYAKV